jgi:hypothetical protein
MGQNLINKSVGGADQSFRWLLHMSGTALAAGGTVSLGDGTDAAMILGRDFVKIRNAAGFSTKLVSSASASRTINLADFDTQFTPPPPPVTPPKVDPPNVWSSYFPTMSIFSAFDVNFPERLFYLPAIGGKTYDIKIVLVLQASVANTNLIIMLNVPGATDVLLVQQESTSSIIADQGRLRVGVNPSINIPYVVIFHGRYTVPMNHDPYNYYSVVAGRDVNAAGNVVGTLYLQGLVSKLMYTNIP